MDTEPDTPPPSPLETPVIKRSVSDSPDSITSPVTKSERVAEEIVTTERAYVQSLVDVVKGYKEPILVYIRSCGLPVAEDDVSALFGNIDDLLKLNSDLLEELEKCPYNPTTIAEAFVTRASDFSVYSAYCTNYPRAVAILTLWQHTPQITENSPKVTQFLKLCQKRLHHALPLGAFLIKPVQRILKYHLLFRELAKCCEKENNRPNSVVQLALDSMSAIADHINTMKQRHEAAVYIQEIQSQLTGWEDDDLSSFGDLLLEESFKVKGAKTERRVFLFRRLLLLVKKKGEHLQYKGSIPIETVTVGDVIKGSGHSFVVTKLSNQDISYELEARTEGIKSNWTGTIKRLMLDAHSPPIQKPYTETTLPSGDRDANGDILNQNRETPPPEESPLRRGSQLSRRNAMRGERKTVKGARHDQVSSISIQMGSHIEENASSPSDETSEVTAVISVKTRQSSSSSRDSTPKRTKLMINKRGEDIEYNPDEQSRQDEDFEVDPYEIESEEEHRESPVLLSDESGHEDENMESVVEEEVSDIQLKLGSEVEMQSGDDKEEERSAQHVDKQPEETEMHESVEQPSEPQDDAFKSSSLEAMVETEMSKVEDKQFPEEIEVLDETETVNQTEASNESELTTHHIEASQDVEDPLKEAEIVESVEKSIKQQNGRLLSSLCSFDCLVVLVIS
jgi:hypothetical protein